MFKQIAEYWCRAMHSRTMWPINGHYECQQCGRVFPVEWQVPEPVVVTTPRRTVLEKRELSIGSTLWPAQ
ncbi:MAG: hypothetical protein C5B51_30600 [Terriglobia bacterium]|nr:MAG: hypothetical protein C5B51_30600 [Terriglobia bacterium]